MTAEQQDRIRRAEKVARQYRALADAKGAAEIVRYTAEAAEEFVAELRARFSQQER